MGWLVTAPLGCRHLCGWMGPQNGFLYLMFCVYTYLVRRFYITLSALPVQTYSEVGHFTLHHPLSVETYSVVGHFLRYTICFVSSDLLGGRAFYIIPSAVS